MALTVRMMEKRSPVAAWRPLVPLELNEGN